MGIPSRHYSASLIYWAVATCSSARSNFPFISRALCLGVLYTWNQILCAQLQNVTRFPFTLSCSLWAVSPLVWCVCQTLCLWVSNSNDTMLNTNHTDSSHPLASVSICSLGCAFTSSSGGQCSLILNPKQGQQSWQVILLLIECVHRVEIMRSFRTVNRQQSQFNAVDLL